MLSILKISKDKGYYRANLVTASKDEEFQTTDVSFYDKQMYYLLLAVGEKEDRFLVYDSWFSMLADDFEKFADSGRDITMTLHCEGNRRLLCVSVDDFGSLWFDAWEEVDGRVVEIKTDLASRPLLVAFDITND